MHCFQAMCEKMDRVSAEDFAFEILDVGNTGTVDRCVSGAVRLFINTVPTVVLLSDCFCSQCC